MERRGEDEQGGGFICVPLLYVAIVWALYKRGHLAARDVRTFFAALEAIRWRAAERRKRRREGDRRDVVPNYRVQDIQRLTGGRRDKVRASLTRLEAVGLLSFRGESARVATSVEELSVDVAEPVEKLLSAFPKRRALPVPRRILRFLAGGRAGAFLATALGHLLRCLYRKDKAWSSEGNVKASWVAKTFGVSERQVLEARARLCELGIFSPVQMEQWHRNRFGGRFRVAPLWKRGEVSTPRSAVPEVVLAPISAAPTKPELPSGEIQKPDLGKSEPAGVCRSRRETEPETNTAGTEGAAPREEAAPEQAPSVRRVSEKDLKDTERLLVLFEQSKRMGWVRDSENDRLRFVGAAEHALAYGKKNRPGLFIHLVKTGLWHFVTQDDEERARTRIRRALHGDGVAPVVADAFVATAAQVGGGGERREPERPRLSDDARLVAACRRAARAGQDPFVLARAYQRDFTRERYEAALEELMQLIVLQRRADAARSVQRVA